jgi:beta-barrel assembly-enhancing protease
VIGSEPETENVIIFTVKKALISLLLALLPATPVVWADGLPDLGEAARADLSPQMERRIGEKEMQEIRAKEPSYVDDPELTDYLDQLTHRLISASDDPGQETATFVLRDPTLNAFAMPGGFIGIHTGLIVATQSESELASVLAHETAHVTQHHMARQINTQSQAQMITLLSLAVALLATRGSSDLAQGALIGGQAAGVQTQLNYSRDFEREADRLGMQRLERAGFDVRAMGSFFERLDKYGRLYDNSAPAYLRTHPLTTERIADMENRIQSLPYRQVTDSLDFLLVRAKLRSQDGVPQEAVTEFAAQLKDGKYVSEAAARYGLVEAHLRGKNYVAADKEMQALRRLKLKSPMFETAAAEIQARLGAQGEATKTLKAAHASYPHRRAISYALVETQLDDKHAAEALQATIADLQNYPTDGKMHALQARSYAQLGRILAQHRAQAEAYVADGQLPSAIEQLLLAQKAPDGDFYEHSEVDARLRQLTAIQAEELKAARR